MITLTDLAARHLQDLLEEQDPPARGVRIFVQGGGCCGLQYGLAYENMVREGDTVVEVKGIHLFVDPVSAQYLAGASLDYQDTPMGTGFWVDNPNAVDTCDCGTSSCSEGGQDMEPCCAE